MTLAPEIENLIYAIFLILGIGLIFFGLATRRNISSDDPQDERLRAIQEKFRAVHARTSRSENAALQKDPRDRRLHAIQERFRAAHQRAIRSKKMQRQLMRWGAAVIALFLAFGVIHLLSRWPLMLTLRHIISFPSCEAARFAGLAPSRLGDPGYYYRHDRDGDGVACETLPRG